jgi:hypothetical protein
VKVVIRKFSHRAIVFVCASLLAVSTAQTASKNSSRALQYLPADTPYKIDSTKPLSILLADKIEPTIDDIEQICQKILRHTPEEKLAEL